MNFNQDDIQVIGEVLFGIITDENDFTVMELNNLNNNKLNWIELEAAFYRNSSPENYVITTIYFPSNSDYGFFGIRMSNNKLRNFRIHYKTHEIKEF